LLVLTAKPPSTSYEASSGLCPIISKDYHHTEYLIPQATEPLIETSPIGPLLRLIWS